MNKLINFIQNHKLILGIIALMVILALILVIVSIKMSFSASLDVLVVPTDATVLINGDKYENGLYENLLAGKAQVVIERDGFDKKEFEIELKRNEVTRLYTYLDGNPEWYEQLKDENTLYLLDIIYEYEGEKHNQSLIEKYPIMTKVPMVYERYLDNYTRYVSFRIDGGKYEKCEEEFCLKITDITGGNHENALNLIKKEGFNPDDYEIIYEDVSKKGHAG